MDLPAQPYEGDESYIFISYSHRDDERVMPVLSNLQEEGYRFWYDEGINPGNEWPETVAAHLNNCSVMLSFISKSYLDSFNCKREIDFAIRKRKPMLYVLLEEVDMSLGMEMQLSTVQSLSMHKTDEDIFYRKLFASGLFEESRDITSSSHVALPDSIVLDEDDDKTVLGDFETYDSKKEKFEVPKVVKQENGSRDDGVNVHYLAAHTVIKEKYRIDDVLGEGGFGITYSGEDTILGLKVAIKEYFPVGSVYRTAPANAVSIIASEEVRKNFAKGKERFLREARTLAKFADKPSVVTVRDFFEENNTAYIVMEYVEGETLSDLLKNRGKLSQEETLQLMEPVMETLSEIHKQGVIHRDISPDNLINDNGRLRLLDFGAADSYGKDDDKSHTVIMKPGYAPQEQYRRDGAQGPWTDVYALCATMYRMITGEPPQDALGRMVKDEVISPAEKESQVNLTFSTALMKGLSVYPDDRYQSVEALLNDLKTGSAYAQLKKENSATEKKVSKERRRDTKGKSGNKTPFRIGFVLAAILVIAVFARVLTSSGNKTITIAGTKYTVNEGTLDLSGIMLTANDLKNIARVNPYHLILSNCDIDDEDLKLIAFSDFSKNLELDLSENENLTNIEVLKDVPVLKTLNISNTQITDISILNELSGLRKIYMNGLGLQSLLPLLGMDLTEIYAGENQLTTLEGLEQSIHLEKIYAPGNRITSLEELKNTKLVKSLDLSGNQITDISALSAFIDTLQYLYLDDNRISDITPLSKARELKVVKLDNNQLKSVHALDQAGQLIALSAEHNQIEELPQIKSEELRILSLADNNISGDVVISSPGKITALMLQHNEIASITSGTGFGSLACFAAYDNPLKNCNLNTERNYYSAYLTFPGKVETWFDKEHISRLKLSDCPYDQRVDVEEINSGVVFMTIDEMDAEIEQIKEEYGGYYAF